MAVEDVNQILDEGNVMLEANAINKSVSHLVVSGIHLHCERQIVQLEVEQQTWGRGSLKDVLVAFEGKVTGLSVDGMENELVVGGIAKLEAFGFGRDFLRFLVVVVRRIGRVDVEIGIL